MMSSTLRAGLGTIGVLTATACVSVLPEQPTPEAVYSLPDPQAAARLMTNVVIREPDSPRIIGGRKITSVGPDGGLKLVPNVAWADRSTRMFQTALLDAFSNDGEGLAVDDVTGVSGAYELYWRISTFTLSGDEGLCTVQLTLLDGRSREPITKTKVEARSSSTANGDPARARALADAGRLCVEQAAQVIADEAVARLQDDAELDD